MATGVKVWSQTAASNASSDSAINWAEGQAPSSVNDSARGMMASVSKWRDDLNGTVVTSGTAPAFTATSNQGFATEAAMDGAKVVVKFHAASGTAPTLAMDGLTARAFQTASGTAIPVNLAKLGSIWPATFVNAIPAWIVHGVPNALPSDTPLPANSVVTATITDANVTYAKIQNVADQRLLGNVSGSAAAPEEITIGAGLKVTSTTLSAPAFPPSGAFKNLSIKVATNTTITVAADFVTTTDGTNYQTTAVSSTVNLGTNGGIDALEGSLSIAIDTWYALWVIAKADGTTKVLANTSATAVTFPSGYTYKARIGWVQTIHGSATLWGTWQLGRRAQYVLGLAQTANMPVMGTGTAGTASVTAPAYAAVAVARFVPTTATEIFVTGTNQLSNGSAVTMGIAPNSSYGGNSSANPPVMGTQVGVGTNGALNASMILESTNIYWYSSGAQGQFNCTGWVDNI